MADYYSILGLNKDASESDIKIAYRKQAKEHHPDKGGDGEQFKKISEAYEILSNPESKKMYDTYGSINPNSGNFGQNFDFNDIFGSGGAFGDFFSNFSGGNRGGQRRSFKKGETIRIKLSLTLEEIYTGVNKQVKLNKKVSCNTCSGQGGTNVKKCSGCNGAGQQIRRQQTILGVIQSTVICPNCQGSGEEYINKCKTCNGDGVYMKEEVMELQIPKGVGHEMILTMQNGGNAIKNGQNGDLQIIIDEIAHHTYIRENNNLICNRFISIPEAILGTSFTFKTIDGQNYTFRTEIGIDSEKVYTIKGKGLPDVNNNSHYGDVFVKTHIYVPKNINEDERNMINKLSSSQNFKPKK
jgi:molecular chaperone DnaJ